MDWQSVVDRCKSQQHPNLEEALVQYTKDQLNMTEENARDFILWERETQEAKNRELAYEARIFLKQVLQALEALCATPRPDVWEKQDQHERESEEEESERLLPRLVCFQYWHERPLVEQEWRLPTYLYDLLTHVWPERCGCEQSLSPPFRREPWERILKACDPLLAKALSRFVPFIQARTRVYAWREVGRRVVVQHCLSQMMPRDVAQLIGSYLTLTVDDRYVQVKRAAQRLYRHSPSCPTPTID